MVGVKQLEQAISYFSDLRIPVGGQLQFVPGTPEIKECTHYLQIAWDAAAKLGKYTPKGLEHLLLPGFNIPMAVRIGESQKTVEILFLLLSLGTAVIDTDGVEQTVRVLSTYKEILPREVMVTKPDEFKSIQSIVEALEMSR